MTTYVHILETGTEFGIEDLQHNLEIFSREYVENRDREAIDDWSLDADNRTSLEDIPDEGSIFDLFVGAGLDASYWVEVERTSTDQFKVLKVY